ncbi:hypothetical protein [uncultured Psychroserpens sp.]|uniref:hypothetical protein n=1 Tax=uncultured Psychroserpens sp. TaxID=255436 RepID=UPI00263431ED|nr:hypothetical protein [uncultured Psychroserpens sp.]
MSNYLKKRIKINNLEKHAGSYFVDESSKIINILKDEGKKVLLGIQKNDNVYTILGEEYVFYSTLNGNKGKFTLSEFSDILHDNALEKGKIFARYKCVKINGNEKIWLKNKSTMKSLWNTILWLEKPSNRDYIYK